MMMIRAVAVALCLAALFALQIVLYVGYVQREVAWNYALHGDPTWYLMFCYRLFEAMMNGDWGVIGRFAKHSPWGVPLFLEAGLNQLVFGRGRLGIVSINLVYFLVAQLATFAFFTWVARSVWGGILAVLLLLAMQTPFRGDGPGLNIVDFHFDLVFFYLLLGILYLVGRSDTFALRGWSIAVGVLAALTVATRLVSVFLLVGVLGVVFLWLVWRWWRRVVDPVLARRRVANMTIAGIVFVALAAIPVWIARKALYAHYFRFVFDRKFAEDRAGLYTMGGDKLVDAWQLIYRMVAYDFALPFAAAAVFLFGLALVGRSAAPPYRARPGEAESRRTFVGVMLIAMVASYIIHLIFPIKSDHLTRMTAAPIFVLISFLTVRPASAALIAVATRWRAVAGLACVGLGVAAAYVQFAFYSGKSRYADRRPELEKVADLYAEMSRIVHARDLRSIAISVDSVSTYELGALLSFVSYEYERHGRFLEPAAKLGDKLDEPVSRADALAEIDQSQFVLLQAGPYDYGGSWPMMKSINAFHHDLAERVRRDLCLVSRHRIEGKERELYVRPQAWRVRASARQGRRFGPDGLLAAGHMTWVAPWGDGIEQWIEFEAAVPVTIVSLGLVVQDSKPERAPRAFRLEAIGEGETRRLLEVTDTSFPNGRQEWRLPAANSVKRYRLTITANRGDPNSVSLRNMWVSLERPPCEFGKPYGDQVTEIRYWQPARPTP